MTAKHFCKLIVPKTMWVVKSYLSFIRQFKRLRTTAELRKKKKDLILRFYELKRKNTDESNEIAYGLKKQVELLVWLLGKKNGI